MIMIPVEGLNYNIIKRLPEPWSRWYQIFEERQRSKRLHDDDDAKKNATSVLGDQ